MGKFFSSLRSRLILLVVLTAIPGIILLLRTGLEQRQHAIQDAQEDVTYLGRMASTMQAVMVDNVKAFLLTLAHMPALREQDVAGCRDLFTHLVDDHFGYYASFYVADLSGKIVCSPPGMHTPPDFDTCNHYRNLIAATDYVFSGYHICDHTGKAVLSIGYPVLNAQGERVLVTNVSLDLIWFYDFAQQAGLPEGAELILLDENGVILSHYPNNDEWRGKTLPESSALSMLFTGTDEVLVGPGLTGEESLFVLGAIEGTGKKITVVLGLPTRLAFAQANQTLQRNLTIMLLVVFGVIVLMWFLGDALIVKQAQRLVQATRRLAQGDLQTRTGLDYSRGELGQLAQAFDGMADQLAEREAERDRHQAALAEYARNLEHSNQELRDFANIAAHDLQEPLRKIQVFGELLQERFAGDLKDRGVEYVQRMRAAAQRMQLLIGGLSVYSRVMTKDYPFSPVELTQVARQVVADLDWQIEQSGARVSVAPLPVVEADPTQMNQLLQNLVSNALKFHQPGAAPVVRIFSPDDLGAPAQNGMCEVRVQDEGIGFEEKFAEKIFQPFQRLHSQADYEGSGMGLAICRKIVDRHGGSIHASSAPGKGATFIILLPHKQSLKGQGPNAIQTQDQSHPVG